MVLVALPWLNAGAEAVAPAHAWGEPEGKDIRPGVAIHAEGRAWCTANFIFSEADTDRVFLGASADCVGSELGDSVYMSDGLGVVSNAVYSSQNIGWIAYSARQYESVGSQPCYVVADCYADEGNRANDLALIEIRDRYRDEVHPAVLHYGGPTKLAEWDDIQVLDRLLIYANSIDRMEAGPTSWMQGYVVAKPRPDWGIAAASWPQVDYGDTGSPVLLPDGSAVGATGIFDVGVPYATTDVMYLPSALEAARAKTGWDLQLETWPRMFEVSVPYIG